MSTNTVDPASAVKLSFWIGSLPWSGWSELAKRKNLDPIDYLRMMVADAVVDAEPAVIPAEEQETLKRLNRMIQKVVEIAVSMFKKGQFTPDITLHVFRAAMADERFKADYIKHIGGKDPYEHGNPLKEINRELGWRIKNALPVDVVKKDGKPVEKRNLKGEVIQSYSLLALRST